MHIVHCLSGYTVLFAGYRNLAPEGQLVLAPGDFRLAAANSYLGLLLRIVQPGLSPGFFDPTMPLV